MTTPRLFDRPGAALHSTLHLGLRMGMLLSTMSRLSITLLLLLVGASYACAGDPSDVDLVLLDNQQRITGTLEEDPEQSEWAVIKTINGTLRLRKARISGIELGVTSRYKLLKEDDLEGLIAFARWARAKNHHQAALSALDRAFNLVRINPKRAFDLEALALYSRLVDELQGPEAGLQLYRWYRTLGGQDAETIARLDQLEAIVGRDDAKLPPVIALKVPAPELQKPSTIVTGAEGHEVKGWQAENPQWSNPAKSEIVPLIGDDRLAGTKRALQVTFGKGDKDKASIKRPVNLDATDSHVLSLHVRSKDAPVRVAIAVKTGNWVYHESTIQAVRPADGWKDLRFDLKEATFKSEQSQWANNAAVEGLDDVKEIQILIYNKGADGKALISGMKFLSDKEL